MATSQKFYNTFSFIYPVIDKLLGGHKKFLAQKANALTGTTLFEIGVGNGSGLRYHIGKSITAIDNSERMLAAAKVENPEAVFQLMDGARLTFAEFSFDTVVMSHVLAVVPNPDALLSEARRVLKAGGHLLILNHFTPKGPLGWLDKAFSPISGLLHFRSAFFLEKLDFSGFETQEILNCGKLGYFKLVTLRKL